MDLFLIQNQRGSTVSLQADLRSSTFATLACIRRIKFLLSAWVTIYLDVTVIPGLARIDFNLKFEYMRIGWISC